MLGGSSKFEMLIWLSLVTMVACAEEAQKSAVSDKSTVKSAGADSQPEFAITSGAVSSEPGVGSLLGILGGGKVSLCTGVEIKDRCILTASHCLSGELKFFQDSFVRETSPFVPVMRQADFKPLVPNPLLNSVATATGDIAVVYAGAKKCQNQQGATTVSNGMCLRSPPFQTGDASWNPKSLGLAAKGDKVKLIGYSGADIQYGNAFIQRSGSFYVDSILDEHLSNGFEIRTYSIFPEAGSDARVTEGDSGGPALKGQTVIGIASTRSLIGNGSSYGGLTGETRHWIDKQKQTLCRKIGNMLISLRSSSGGVADGRGFKIKMVSTDSVGDLNRTINCNDAASCSSQYINLHAEIIPPTNWSFMGWENIPGSSCPCNGNSPTCDFKADDLSYKDEVDGQICATKWKFQPNYGTPTH